MLKELKMVTLIKNLSFVNTRQYGLSVVLKRSNWFFSTYCVIIYQIHCSTESIWTINCTIFSFTSTEAGKERKERKEGGGGGGVHWAELCLSEGALWIQSREGFKDVWLHSPKHEKGPTAQACEGFSEEEWGVVRKLIWAAWSQNEYIFSQSSLITEARRGASNQGMN